MNCPAAEKVARVIDRSQRSFSCAVDLTLNLEFASRSACYLELLRCLVPVFFAIPAGDRNDQIDLAVVAYHEQHLSRQVDLDMGRAAY